MRPFVFSGDAHLAEPSDLYSSKLPAHLQQWALHTEAEAKSIVIKLGEKPLMKVWKDFHDHTTGKLESPDVKRL